MTEKSSLDKKFKIPYALFDVINRNVAEEYKLIPISIDDRVLKVAGVDKSIQASNSLRFIAEGRGVEFEFEQIDEELFNELIKQYQQQGSSVNQALDDLLKTDTTFILGEDRQAGAQAEAVLKDEGPVIKLIANILEKAVELKASDIHIEPLEKESLVRLRIDGLLEKLTTYPKKFHPPIVTRIKLQAKLPIDEKRRPLDGRFSAKSQTTGKKIDYRVATFPVGEEGDEKIVLRVLDKDVGLIPLEKLGLTRFAKKQIQQAVKRPYGLILITGPTGSGKTTTLYALLNSLDKNSKNFVSLEDPVEYILEGVNQSNIRPEIGYGFPEGLRSILRGDPDQILVGEIRDRETAQLCVQAALTGHTVYSTIHTNTAIGVIDRLKNFGIDPFLLAPTLSLVLGQRMAPRLDGEGVPISIKGDRKKAVDKLIGRLPKELKDELQQTEEFRDVLPTEENPRGIKGRIGIYEIFEIDKDIEKLILGDASKFKIEALAREKGMLSLYEDAVLKALNGVIPYYGIEAVASEADLDGDIKQEVNNDSI